MKNKKDQKNIPSSPNKPKSMFTAIWSGVIFLGRRIKSLRGRLYIVLKQSDGTSESIFKCRAFSMFIYMIFYAVVIVISSFFLFFKTPLISSIGIIGENRYLSIESVIDNIMPVENDSVRNELIFKYIVCDHNGVVIDRDKIINTVLKYDSLHNEVALWKLYIANISQILAGEKAVIKADTIVPKLRSQNDFNLTRSSIDSLLGVDAMNQISGRGVQGNKDKIYAPLEGDIVAHFDYKQNINGVRISSNKITPVVSVMNGTVILSTWSSTNGNILQIQHENNTISIYMGLSQLVKNVGERVGAREVIGFIGGNGADREDVVKKRKVESTLYFELWRDGTAIDPEKYILF